MSKQAGQQSEPTRLPTAHLSEQDLRDQAAGKAPASEATKIEQSRATAEVQGAIVVAQERPRDVALASRSIIESCALMALAERAFFSYPRGGKTVTGASIHLAVELARNWGNTVYGIHELARNDRKRESEMLAFAWDIQTNTRVQTAFVVPHRRDKRGGPQILTDMRDIYENNANQGARRVRECILRIIPPWLLEDAKAACWKTLESGGGKPLEQRQSECLTFFEGLGISRDQLEKRTGKPLANFTDLDLAGLRVLGTSIKRGEISADEDFESDRPQAATKALKDNAAQSPKADSPPADEPQAATETAKNAEKPTTGSQQIKRQFADAKTLDELQEAYDAAHPQIEEMTDDLQNELAAEYSNREQELGDLKL